VIGPCWNCFRQNRVHRRDNPSVRRVSPCAGIIRFWRRRLGGIASVQAETSVDGILPCWRTSRDFSCPENRRSVRELLPFQTQLSFEGTSLSGGGSTLDFGRQWILGNGGELLPSQYVGYFGRSIRRGSLSGEYFMKSFRSKRELLPVNPSGLSRSTPPSRGSPSSRIVRLRISLSWNRFRFSDTPAVEVSSVRRHLFLGISSWMGNLPSENRFPSGFPPWL
jgi:hypothetical protein